MTKIVRKLYQPNAALDLRRSSLSRGLDLASSMKNVDYATTTDGDALTQRKGWKEVARMIGARHNVYNWYGGNQQGLLSILKYSRTDSDNGSTIIEKLLLSNNLHPIKTKTVTFTYSGGDTATIDIKGDGTQYYCNLYEGGFPVLQQALESNLTLGELKTAVDAVTGFSLTIDSGHSAVVAGAQNNKTTLTVDDGSGGAHDLEVGEWITFTDSSAQETVRKITATTSTTISFDGALVSVDDNAAISLKYINSPALNLDQTIDKTISSTLTVNFIDFDSAYFPVNFQQPLAATLALIDDPNFVPPNAVSLNNVLYVSAPFELNSYAFQKYDGQNFYRVGLPKPTIEVSAAGSGTGVDAGLHRYRATVIHHDAQGNITESEPSDEVTLSLSSAENVSITLGAALTAGNYPISSARASSTQAGVNTIAVDNTAITQNDHSLHVGDEVYLYDRDSSAYVVRNVTAATYPHDGTGGTITIDGAAVDVNDNDPISQNLRYGIYRTVATGNQLKLVAEIPVDVGQSGTTTSYTDSTADSALGADFTIPSTNEAHTAPNIAPTALAVYQGSLIAAGSRDNPNTIYASVPGSPEYFPATLSFNIGADTSDVVTGAQTSGQFLLLFKENSTYILSGQILNPTSALPAFRVDRLSETVGAVNQHSIKEVEGAVFFLSKKGPHRITGGGRPDEVGFPIFPIFTKPGPNDNTKLQLRRATAVYDPLQRKYLLFVPVEFPATDSTAANETLSRVFVYDVDREAWREWTNMVGNAAGFVDGEELWFAARTDTYQYVARRLNSGTVYDYEDAGQAIDWELITGWETGGEPSAYKKFNRSKVYTTFGSTSPSFTLRVRTRLNFTNTDHSDYTVDLTSGKPFEDTVLLINNALALQFRFSHNTIYEQVLLTGYELEMVGSSLEQRIAD